MNKNTATWQTLTMIAGDAIDQLRIDKEQVRWMEALMRAIGFDLKNGGHDAAALAGLGRHLACDLAHFTGCRIDDLQGALDAAEEGRK